MVGMLFYVSLSKFGQEFNEEKVKETLGEVEIDKLLGEYEAFNAARLWFVSLQDSETNII